MKTLQFLPPLGIGLQSLFDFAAFVRRKIVEQVGAEHLFAVGPVEALDVGVLVGLARLDEARFDVPLRGGLSGGERLRTRSGYCKQKRESSLTRARPESKE